jgi:hypothetical protein
MKGSPGWESKKAGLEDQGLGTGDEDILRRWEKNGQIARARGHLLHYHAEMMVRSLTFAAL